MRPGFLGLTLLAVQSFAFSVQQPPAAVLENNTDISVELVNSLDAKKTKVGDKIEAKLIRDLSGRDNVLIAREMSKLMGHVIEVEPRSEQNKHSPMIIAFDAIVTDNGQEIPVNAIVKTIYPPVAKQPSPARIGSFPTSGDSPAARASGPMVDPGSGRIVVPAHAPTSSTGIAGLRVPNVPEMGPIGLAANALGQTRLTALDRKDVKMKSGTIFVLRLNSPGTKQ